MERSQLRPYLRSYGGLRAAGARAAGKLRGDETVLDAGCGSGRVTQALIERLPQGRVIAVDASDSMVQAARERLGEQADVRVMDLLELELQEPVDAVLSTATSTGSPIMRGCSRACTQHCVPAGSS